MTQPNIIIVEDNLIIALDIQERLEKYGYKVSAIVASGEKAITKTAELKPDLVIMDIGLKGELNGIETGKIISNKFKVPIIYLTGNTELLKNANITDPYITKPFEDEEFKKIVTTLLGI